MRKNSNSKLDYKTSIKFLVKDNNCKSKRFNQNSSHIISNNNSISKNLNYFFKNYKTPYKTNLINDRILKLKLIKNKSLKKKEIKNKINSNFNIRNSNFKLDLYDLNRSMLDVTKNKINKIPKANNNNILKMINNEKLDLTYNDIMYMKNNYNKINDIISIVKDYSIFFNLNRYIINYILINSEFLEFKSNSSIDKDNYYLIILGSINIYKKSLVMNKYKLIELKKEGNLWNIEKFFINFNDKSYEYKINENSFLIKFNKQIWENYYLNTIKNKTFNTLNFVNSHYIIGKLKYLEQFSLVSYLKYKKINYNKSINDKNSIVIVKEGLIRYNDKNNFKILNVQNKIFYKNDTKIYCFSEKLVYFYLKEKYFNKVFNSVISLLKNNSLILN